MEAHAVLFAEGFADGVDAHDAHHAGEEGVDALVGRARGVRGLAAVGDELAAEAVRGVSDRKVAFGVGRRIDVHLQRHVDVVKTALGDDLGLAAQKLDLLFFAQLVAVFDFHILFGGDRKEHEVAPEVLHGVDVLHRHRDGEEVGDLHVVAATVGGAGDGVAHGMFAADDGVEFAQERHGAAVAGAREAGLDARDAEARFIGDAEAVEGFLHLRARLHFLVAEFGFFGDRHADRADVVETLFNGGAQGGLQFFLGHDELLLMVNESVERNQKIPSRCSMISARKVAQRKLPAATASATGTMRQESWRKASRSLPRHKPP